MGNTQLVYLQLSANGMLLGVDLKNEMNVKGKKGMKRRGLTWEGRRGGGGAMGVTHGMADCRGNCGVTGACVKSD
jgi:hypothetical protein